MKNFNRISTTFLALGISFALLLTTACATGGEVALAETPELTPTAVPTPTPTATKSPTPTEEPTPTPTPQKIEAKAGIKKGQDKVEAEVNQRFEDFLNGTGEFTDEKIREKAFASNYTNTAELGCVEGLEENYFLVQGIILAYKITNQGEVFAFGTKNKKGSRIIAAIAYPSESFIINNVEMELVVYPNSDLDATPRVQYFDRRNSLYYDFLDSHVGKISTICIPTKVSAESRFYYSYSDTFKMVLSESIDPAIGYNSSFMTNVNFIDSEFVNSSESAKYFYNSRASSILIVSCFSDLESLVTINCTGLPNVVGFYFTEF